MVPRPTVTRNALSKERSHPSLCPPIARAQTAALSAYGQAIVPFHSVVAALLIVGPERLIVAALRDDGAGPVGRRLGQPKDV